MVSEEIEFRSPVEYFEIFRSDPASFLLESGGSGRMSRYSFLGSSPFAVIKSRGDRVSITSGGKTSIRRGDPFGMLDSLLLGYSVQKTGDIPPFPGGAVGYMGYDLCHFTERLPRRSRDDLGLPDMYMGLYDWVLAFDHKKKRAWIVSPRLPGESLKRAVFRADRIKERIKGRLFSGACACTISGSASRRVGIVSNFTRSGYIRAVRKAKEYIRSGDIFQVNLSQRFKAALMSDPYEVYLRLRKINPAPFAGYLGFPGLSLLSASPERFLRISDRDVHTRPIKGTRPRGEDRTSDSRLGRELKASTKDNAELLMIVDLERNDLGRVCEYGSVSVPELVRLERHPTVFHLVGTVKGRLRPGVSHVECIKNCFPGGSITGAPKIRAMEIIDELEPTRRSAYTGCIGYLGFNRQTDMNIVIRTMICYEGSIYFQAGGGIVHDSEPGLEYQETLHKAKALMDAVMQG